MQARNPPKVGAEESRVIRSCRHFRPPMGVRHPFSKKKPRQREGESALLMHPAWLPSLRMTSRPPKQ